MADAQAEAKIFKLNLLWLNFPVVEAELPSFLGVAEALNGNSFLGQSILG